MINVTLDVGFFVVARLDPKHKDITTTNVGMYGTHKY